MTKDKLAEGHMWLTWHMALNFESYGAEVEELQGIAAYALAKAIDDFDPKYGASFYTHAAFRITRELQHYRRYLRQKRHAPVVMSLSDIVRNDGDLTIAEVVSSQEDTAENAISNILIRKMHDAIERLPDRLRKTCYVMLSGEFRSEYIGKKTGVSQSMAYHDMQKAFAELRRFMGISNIPYQRGKKGDCKDVQGF